MLTLTLTLNNQVNNRQGCAQDLTTRGRDVESPDRDIDNSYETDTFQGSLGTFTVSHLHGTGLHMVILSI